jgi:hypothetical protein
MQLHFAEFQAPTRPCCPFRLGAHWRALCLIEEAEFFGRFRDLDAHDDSTLYSKEEPPQHLGVRSLPGDVTLDFILRDLEAGYVGIECKNVRPWLYPDRDEVIETLKKCLALRCLPVIIGRRVPYVSFMLLSKCGVLFHQNYTQLFPNSEKAIADQRYSARRSAGPKAIGRSLRSCCASLGRAMC